jgi:hypothetical protein
MPDATQDPGKGVGGCPAVDGQKVPLLHVLGTLPHVPGALGTPAKAAQPLANAVAPTLLSDTLDDSEKLNALPEWNNFTPLQRQIVLELLEDPLAEDKAIAAKVGCSVRTVIKLQHSAAYEKVTEELVKANKTKLRLGALNVMAQLLRAEKESVRLDAAKSLLKDQGMLKEPEKTTNTNKKIEVSWKQAPPPPSPLP